MTDFGPYARPDRPLDAFAGPALPAAAFGGVRTRRLVAFCLDFALVSVAAMLLWTVLFVITVGLAAFILPPLWPFVAFFYNGTTVAGPRMGTPGMCLLDIEMRTIDGAPVSFVMAGVHAVLLYASWLFPPLFLVSLITPDKRCLHDIVAGVVVVRRPF